MVRLLSALSALVIAATVVWLSVRGAELLFPLFQVPVHPGRIGRVGHLFTFFTPMIGAIVAVVLGVKEKRAKRDDDVPLTPLVRRLPSGLREL